MELAHFENLIDENQLNNENQVDLNGQQNIENNNDDSEVNQDDNSNDDESNENNEGLSAIELFLKENGVRDGKTIIYENDEGVEEEVDFNSLTSEEQLNVIKTLTDPGLTNDEIEVINFLRSNKTSLNEIVEYNKQKAIEEYLSENPDAVREQYYSVDEYSDDELYLAHLKNLYPNLTDEEYLAELELSKEKEESFNKKVEAIRSDYKQREQQYLEEQETLRVQQYNEFKNSLIDSAQSFESIPLDYTDSQTDILYIDENDRNRVLSYILDADKDGESKFFKDLNDPAVIMELAWYRLYGKNAISEISKYWKSVLAEERKNKSSNDNQTNNQKSTTVTKDNNKKDVKGGFNPFETERILPFKESQIKYEHF